MFCVMTGGYLFFRAMSPSHNKYIVSDEEREMMRGGDMNQTTAGNKTARPPEKGLRVG